MAGSHTDLGSRSRAVGSTPPSTSTSTSASTSASASASASAPTARITPRHYGSDCDGSSTGGSDRAGPSRRRKRAKAGLRWLSSMVGWLSTSEPSLKEWKEFRSDQFRQYHVSAGDSALQASSKVRAPVGSLPRTAQSPSGPAPEERWHKMREKKGKPGHGGGGGEDGERPGSEARMREQNLVTPWEV